MQQYVKDLIDKLNGCEDPEFMAENLGTVIKYLKDAQETLELLDSTRRELIRQKQDLKTQLSGVPHWVTVKEERPTYSCDYVVRIRDASAPTTLYYNTSTKLWYGDDNDTYAVTHWLKGLELPEV